MKNYIIAFIAVFAFSVSCKKKDEPKDNNAPPAPVFSIESSAFKNDSNIPAKYTCDDANVSPAIKWAGAPEGTQSFALIMDDPDAPTDTFVHWVVYNISTVKNELPEGIADGSANGVTHGKSSFNVQGYRGPCPPSGTHRYFFILYALDKIFNLPGGKTKAELKKEMQGHILQQIQLVGKYSR